ncbi:hypothetical protein FHS11_005413 [Mucilaginibacter gotjawali]|uniref:Uncharacterized protein n=1 Tax=Mucilaginibacter gotjawali TaxID=1550579 RepID=A0A839SNL2_9SPHI|nr:hypothetical protein [Mucilaginibacter gotjawali]
MKTEMKPLSRGEMKKVLGGVNFTIWNCAEGQQCSSTDPSVRCGLTSCTNTGVRCNNTACV